MHTPTHTKLVDILTSIVVHKRLEYNTTKYNMCITCFIEADDSNIGHEKQL